MLERIDKTAFLRQGLSHYPDGRETIDYFEESVQKGMSLSFEAKKSWNKFQPARDPGGSLQFTKATGVIDRYIYVYIAGMFPNRSGVTERAFISLGLLWSPRFCQIPVVAYCAGTLVKGGSIPVHARHGDPRVTIGPVFKKNERRLLFEATSDFDPDEAFPLLLDCLDDDMDLIEIGSGVSEPLQEALQSSSNTP